MAEPTSTTALVAKTAVTTLTDERLRKGRAWTTGLLLLPVILISMLICSLFLGNISEDYQEYIGDMRDGFRLLDGTIDSMNNEMEDGDRLDSMRVRQGWNTDSLKKIYHLRGTMIGLPERRGRRKLVRKDQGRKPEW